VTEVVPALFDLREARAFVAMPSGEYRAAGPPLALPTTVLSAEAGSDEHPVVALTDDGLAEIKLVGPEGAETLALVPILAAPSAFADTEAILADFDALKDVDADGVLDAVIPTADGLEIHRGDNGGFAEAASFRGSLPGDERQSTMGAAQRTIRLPRARTLMAIASRISWSALSTQRHHGSRSLEASAVRGLPRPGSWSWAAWRGPAATSRSGAWRGPVISTATDVSSSSRARTSIRARAT
jgi:hypothetical protein